MRHRRIVGCHGWLRRSWGVASLLLLVFGLPLVSAPLPAHADRHRATQQQRLTSTLEAECLRTAIKPPSPFQYLHAGREPWHAHGYDYNENAFLSFGSARMPEECDKVIRRNGYVEARFRDSKHSGWWLWLTSLSISNKGTPTDIMMKIGSFALRNGEVGCLKDVRLNYWVKLKYLRTGKRERRLVLRQPPRRVSCGGTPTP